MTQIADFVCGWGQTAGFLYVRLLILSEMADKDAPLRLRFPLRYGRRLGAVGLNLFGPFYISPTNTEEFVIPS